MNFYQNVQFLFIAHFRTCIHIEQFQSKSPLVGQVLMLSKQGKFARMLQNFMNTISYQQFDDKIIICCRTVNKHNLH